jgi:alkylation response protein AidB-like acyl-CoA dehydrogenase
MNLDFTADEIAFREEVRSWLADHAPQGPLSPAGPERLAFDKQWQRTLYDHGWAGLSWPAEYGGRALSLIKQLIWYEEVARAGAPGEGVFFIALNHAGPTLIARGTDVQKTTYLPPILRGETPWCQGFSEPNSGSDLASLRTSGVVDGDHLVVNGSKIWSTGAHQSDYQELLIRTDAGSKRHAGLSWVIGDMHLPGVEVRPIRAMEGDVHFCEVFYNDVRIPLANVVGKLNDGWNVAMATLEIERATASLGERIEIARIIEQLIELARTTTDHAGRPVIEAGDIAARLSLARAEAATLRAMSYMTISRVNHGSLGPEGIIPAVYGTELVQRVHKLAMDIIGVRALAMDGWPKRYLFSRSRTIAGGTAQIRRNIIGERLLGLPRGR